MSDLPQRLRLNATIPLVMEAADRIEALEAALKEAGEMWVRKDNRIEQLEAAREAMELARNIIHGPLHNATRERDYAKAAEYQSYIATLNAALAPETEKWRAGYEQKT